MAEKGLLSETCVFCHSGCWGRVPPVPLVLGFFARLEVARDVWLPPSLPCPLHPSRNRRTPGVSLRSVPLLLSGAVAGTAAHVTRRQLGGQPAGRGRRGSCGGPLFPRYKPSPERMVCPRVRACLNIVFDAPGPPTHTPTAEHSALVPQISFPA